VVRALEFGDGDEAGWNVVCNNGNLIGLLSIRFVGSDLGLGERAAQTIPHVHYHIIPRPPLAPIPTEKQKSWVTFGRGMRGDLDEDETSTLAERLRRAVDVEIERLRQKEGHEGLQLLGLEVGSGMRERGKL
jgi:hypothetical protein